MKPALKLHAIENTPTQNEILAIETALMTRGKRRIPKEEKMEGKKILSLEAEVLKQRVQELEGVFASVLGKLQKVNLYCPLVNIMQAVRESVQELEKIR